MHARNAVLTALVLVAGCGSSPTTTARTSRTPDTASSATSSAIEPTTEAPPGGATPSGTKAATGAPVSRLRLSAQSHGGAFRVTLGAVVTLTLPTGFDWDPVAASNDVVLVIASVSEAAAPPAWEIRTQHAGTTTLRAHGRPVCIATQSCPVARDFGVTLEVVG